MDFNEYPSKRSISTDGFFSADRRPRRGLVDPTQKLSKKEEKSLADSLLTSSPAAMGGNSLLNKNLVTARAIARPPEETKLPPQHKPPKEKKEPKSHPWKKRVKRTLLVIVLVFVIIAGYDGFKFYRNIAKITHDYN